MPPMSVPLATVRALAPHREADGEERLGTPDGGCRVPDVVTRTVRGGAEGRRELPAESEEIPDAAPPHREIDCLPSAAASRTWQVAS